VGWISRKNLHSGRGGVFFLTSLFIELTDLRKRRTDGTSWCVLLTVGKSLDVKSLDVRWKKGKQVSGFEQLCQAAKPIVTWAVRVPKDLV
jgi:hypothetical protein